MEDNTILKAEPLPANTSSAVTANPHIPSVSASAVLGESESMPEGTPICRGYDFNKTLEEYGKNDGKDKEKNILDDIMSSMLTTGFQATNVGLAIEKSNVCANGACQMYHGKKAMTSISSHTLYDPKFVHESSFPTHPTKSPVDSVKLYAFWYSIKWSMSL
mmetsp:Transcript_51805/g.77461  ORF Transcript_51805/g.77461 Transcript_51805/m.77461 type:complete len:161 (+) Transcript_51805:101-583(+)